MPERAFIVSLLAKMGGIEMGTYNAPGTTPFYADSISGSGNDTIYGDSANNTIYGGYGIDYIYGRDGNDNLYGGSHGDYIYGEVGDDYIEGGDEPTTVTGDYLSGGDGVDTIYGGMGNDRIFGGAGDDWMLAGEDDDDTIQGDGGADYIVGGNGNDTLYGDDPSNSATIVGNDKLRGGAGNDTLYGGYGNDVLQGEQGADVLTGGAGSDAFTFASIDASTLSLSDTITDFSQASGSPDKIDFQFIDTNPTLAGDQAFTFVGAASFVNDGVARVRWFQSGTNTFVQADTGDGVADLNIKLNGTYVLAVADFNL